MKAVDETTAAAGATADTAAALAEAAEPRLWQLWVATCRAEDVSPTSPRAFMNPALRGSLAIQTVRRGRTTVARRLRRNRVLKRWHCDVHADAVIGPGLRTPHPFGIVIGSGSRLGTDVAICQHVTIGQIREEYPVIGDGVTLFPGAVVIGPVVIPAGARILPNAVVRPDTPFDRAHGVLLATGDRPVDLIIRAS